MWMHNSPVWLDGWLPGRWTLGLAALGGSLLWSAKNQLLLVSLEVFVRAESVSLYTGVIVALIRLERLGRSSSCGKLECKNLPNFLYLNQYRPA